MRHARGEPAEARQLLLLGELHGEVGPLALGMDQGVVAAEQAGHFAFGQVRGRDRFGGALRGGAHVRLEDAHGSDHLAHEDEAAEGEQHGQHAVGHQQRGEDLAPFGEQVRDVERRVDRADHLALVDEVTARETAAVRAPATRRRRRRRRSGRACGRSPAPRPAALPGSASAPPERSCFRWAETIVDIGSHAQQAFNGSRVRAAQERRRRAMPVQTPDVCCGLSSRAAGLPCPAGTRAPLSQDLRSRA